MELDELVGPTEPGEPPVVSGRRRPSGGGSGRDRARPRRRLLREHRSHQPALARGRRVRADLPPPVPFALVIAAAREWPGTRILVASGDAWLLHPPPADVAHAPPAPLRARRSSTRPRATRALPSREALTAARRFPSAGQGSASEQLRARWIEGMYLVHLD